MSKRKDATKAAHGSTKRKLTKTEAREHLIDAAREVLRWNVDDMEPRVWAELESTVEAYDAILARRSPGGRK